MSKRRNKIFLAFCLTSIVLICTVQVRFICKGIVQFRFRPTKTCVCLFICDGLLHTEDGIKPITMHDDGKVTYGYHWPSCTTWRGELDEPMILVPPVFKTKPEPATKPPEATNNITIQADSGTVTYNATQFETNRMSGIGPSGSVIMNDGNGVIFMTNGTFSNLIVQSEYPKILRHDPAGDGVTWGWNGLVAPNRPKKFHWPDPGMVIETDEQTQPAASDWR